MYTAGVDLGTTTISLILMDVETGTLKARKTIAHNSFMEGPFPESRIQDPQRIVDLALDGLRELASRVGGIGALKGIGMTGQMHGMLYVDRDGNAVSPLYTWQDGCGNRILPSGQNSAAYLKEKIGNAASGYGITTHYFLQEMGLIPGTAVSMTTISDYLAMKLCGNTSPVLASDMAASWGCFDLRKGVFPGELLREAGVDVSYLPKVCREHEIIGRTPEGVPVISSLGDNQASVIGSVQDLGQSVLLNIGTGAQVTVGCEQYYDVQGSIELRPCVDGTYIMAGSGLCGGRAYAMLEQFFEGVLRMAEGELSAEAKTSRKDEGAAAEKEAEKNRGGKKDLYAVMGQEAERFIGEHGKEAAWQILPTFSGTRSNPDQCGKIDGLKADNFTPGAMTAGMLLGVIGELHGYYRQMCGLLGREAKTLIGSGNGLRKNPLMRRLAEEMFGLEMKIPRYEEEAACGAALCAMAAAGITGSLKDAQQKIQYL